MIPHGQFLLNLYVLVFYVLCTFLINETTMIHGKNLFVNLLHLLYLQSNIKFIIIIVRIIFIIHNNLIVTK